MVCSRKYYHDPGTNFCVECSGSTTSIAFAVFLAVLGLAMAFGLYKFTRTALETAETVLGDGVEELADGVVGRISARLSGISNHKEPEESGDHDDGVGDNDDDANDKAKNTTEVKSPNFKSRMARDKSPKNHDHILSAKDEARQHAWVKMKTKLK